MLANLGIAIMVLAMVNAVEAQNSGNPVTVRHFVAPQYPAAAWLGRVEGEVTAELTIAPNGHVRSVEVAPQYPLLRHPVEVALKQWTFQPLSGVTRISVLTRFGLDADCPQTNTPPPTNYYVYTTVTADLPRVLEIRTCMPIVVVNSSGR